MASTSSLEEVLVEVENLRWGLHADIKKQEESRQQLQLVYNSSEWYSARYLAGKALGILDREPRG